MQQFYTTGKGCVNHVAVDFVRNLFVKNIKIMSAVVNVKKYNRKVQPLAALSCRKTNNSLLRKIKCTFAYKTAFQIQFFFQHYFKFIQLLSLRGYKADIFSFVAQCFNTKLYSFNHLHKAFVLIFAFMQFNRWTKSEGFRTGFCIASFYERAVFFSKLVNLICASEVYIQNSCCTRNIKACPAPSKARLEN